MKPALSALIGWFLIASAAVAQDFAGVATAVDADHLTIGETRFALYGIDAPDPDQADACFVGRLPFGCYDNALRQLQMLISLGPIECTDTGDVDLYGTPYMTCTAGGEDIGEAVVRAGVAMAFRHQTDKYVEAEEAAKAEPAGLWQPGIRFDMPWDWRFSRGRPIGP